MDKAEFDKFAEEYYAVHVSNLGASGEKPEFFTEYKVRDISLEVKAMARDRIERILDFGAGICSSLPYFRSYVPEATVTCLDVSQKSLAIGEKRFPGYGNFITFDGETIPFREGSFDIAFAACVFHHIDHDKHGMLLMEIHRVLKPGGALFLFEHNPYNPLTVRAVNTCPFDENAHLVKAAEIKRRVCASGFVDAVVRYRVFFPGPLRKLRPLELALRWLPLGAQYYVRADKKPAI